jgi:hypothetical protein
MSEEKNYLKVFNDRCSEEIWKIVSELSIERCNGCEIGHPSQNEHSCLMDSLYIKLIYYFELAFIKLDIEKIYCSLLEEYTCDQDAIITFWDTMKVTVNTDIWKHSLFTRLEKEAKQYDF